MRAVLGAAESLEDVALYGRSKHARLAQSLALRNGSPSRDTFRRVLMLIDPDAFGRSFLGRARTMFRPEGDGPRQVAIGGETVRLVSAYATERGLVPARRAAETKGGELAVLPEPLDRLGPRGRLVSLDALACHPGGSPAGSRRAAATT